MFVVGVLPNLILRPTAASVNELLTRAEERRVVQMDESNAQAWAGTIQLDGPSGGSQ